MMKVISGYNISGTTVSLGAFETNSAAAGTLCVDEAVKSAGISIIDSGAVCAGKYIAVFQGSAASVRAALLVAASSLPQKLFWSELYIGRVSPSLIEVISGVGAPLSDSIGLFESYSIVQSIEAADLIMKRSDIKIVNLRLGRGIGGKSVVIFTGNLPEVKDCFSYLKTIMPHEGALSDICILEHPHSNVISLLTKSFFIKQPPCNLVSEDNLSQFNKGAFHSLSGGLS
jgi:microcompartment protein CcmL/EutN